MTNAPYHKDCSQPEGDKVETLSRHASDSVHLRAGCKEGDVSKNRQSPRQVQRFVSPRRHPWVTVLPPGIPSMVMLAQHLTVSGSGFQPLLHAPGCGAPKLSITFGPIVGNAEHLAVFGRAFAAFAPCGDVVRVHFGELPYLAFIGTMANCAERTI